METPPYFVGGKQVAGKVVGRLTTGTHPPQNPIHPQDWPSVYFRRVQNQLSEQPQHRNNVLRLWYADGFLNAFKGAGRLLSCWLRLMSGWIRLVTGGVVIWVGGVAGL